MRENENCIIIICLYIDNTFCVGDDSAIEKFKKEIKDFLSQKKAEEMNMWGA